MTHLEVETRRVPSVTDGPFDEPMRRPSAPVDDRRRLLVGLAVLTLVGLVLRWIAAQESLYGDELTSYALLKPAAFPDVFRDTSSPPLYLIVGWLAARVGDPLTSIRWPSVLAGTATVPVLYLLGKQIAGRRSGIVAAALFAVMPYAVFYGSEARPYALMVFFAALSTLALLKALKAQDSRWWWVLYWAASIGVLASHYTGGVVLALQALWALGTQGDRRRAVLAANAAIVIPLLPWIPQLDNNISGLRANEFFHPLTLHNIVVDPLRIAFGHPAATFGQVPGTLSIVLWSLAGAMIAIGLLRPDLLGRVGLAEPAPTKGAPAGPVKSRSPLLTAKAGWLLGLLTLGTLIVILVYSELADNSIWSSRHVMVVLPYICLAFGVVVAAQPRRLGLIAGAAVVLAAFIGSVRMVEDYPRPDLHAAADAIEQDAPPGTFVVQPWRNGSSPPRQPGVSIEDDGVTTNAFEQAFAIYLDGRYPLIRPGSPRDWPIGRTVYGVEGGMLPRGVLRFFSQGAGAVPIETLNFKGFSPVTVTIYRATAGNGIGQKPAAPAGDLGSYLRQHPGALGAYLQQHPDAANSFERSRGTEQNAP